AEKPDPARVEGRTLAEELRSQKPARNSRFDGLLKIRDGTGNLIQVTVQLRVIAEDNQWQSVYEAFSAVHVVTEKMTVVHGENQPNHYLLARAANPGEPLGAPAALTGEKAAVAFAGSDFWLTDLGLEFIHWPEQRVVKREMRKGRACKVLESTCPNPSDAGYARVLSWVDAETGGLLRAEAYDKQRQLLKEFTVRSLKKVNGRWELKEMEIRNDQTGSRTRLELNVTVE
ncbi:MAG: outer membrane lipoprotein-sorting protein, partial [Limisphaerales bacterium]